METKRKSSLDHYSLDKLIQSRCFLEGSPRDRGVLYSRGVIQYTLPSVPYSSDYFFFKLRKKPILMVKSNKPFVSISHFFPSKKKGYLKAKRNPGQEIFHRTDRNGMKSKY